MIKNIKVNAGTSSVGVVIADGIRVFFSDGVLSVFGFI